MSKTFIIAFKQLVGSVKNLTKNQISRGDLERDKMNWVINIEIRLSTGIRVDLDGLRVISRDLKIRDISRLKGFEEDIESLISFLDLRYSLLIPCSVT